MNSKPRKIERVLKIAFSGLLLSLLLPATLPALAQPEGQPPAVDGLRDEPSEAGNRPRKQMKRRMMERMQGGMPGEQDGREGRMKRLGNFISFMSTYLTSVKDPHQAAGLAALSIKDVYKKQGKPLEAEKVIEEAIGSTKDQSMRNVLLFSLRQIYEENNQSDKVLEVSKRILKENVAGK